MSRGPGREQRFVLGQIDFLERGEGLTLPYLADIYAFDNDGKKTSVESMRRAVRGLERMGRVTVYRERRHRDSEVRRLLVGHPGLGRLQAAPGQETLEQVARRSWRAINGEHCAHCGGPAPVGKLSCDPCHEAWRERETARRGRGLFGSWVYRFLNSLNESEKAAIRRGEWGEPTDRLLKYLDALDESAKAPPDR